MKSYRKITTRTFIIFIILIAIFNPNTVLGDAFSLGFSQIDFAQGVDSLSNSDWGSAELMFMGQTGFQYFNLVVDGSWRVQNMPVWSLEGIGVTQSLNFYFNLGNIIGDNVTSVSFLPSLTSTMLSGPPTGVPSTAIVTDQIVTIGGLAGPVGPIPSATLFLIGKIPVDWAFKLGVPNQEVGVDECVPGAFSNSLRYLDAKFSLSIPEDKKSIEGLKPPTHWVAPLKDLDGNPIPGTGGCPVNAWEGKKDFIKHYIITKFFLPNAIDQVLEELRYCEDVELWGDHHAAVVVGLIKNLDGTYTIYVKHDIEQGRNGGTSTEAITYDPSTGLLTGGAPGFFDGFGIRGFVSESVPLPGAVWLFGSGLAGLVGLGRRFKKIKLIRVCE